MAKGSTLQKDLMKNQDLRVGEIVRNIKVETNHEVLRISHEKDATYIKVSQRGSESLTYGSEAFFSLYSRYQDEHEKFNEILGIIKYKLEDESDSQSVGEIIDDVLTHNIDTRIDEKRLKYQSGLSAREVCNIVFNVLLRDNGDECDDDLIDEALEVISLYEN